MPATIKAQQKSVNAPDANSFLSTSQSPCTCFKVRSLARQLTQLYDDALAASGLTVTQYGLLAHARRPRGADAPLIGELASLMFTDRTTLTRNLKPLIAAGLIEIQSGADARTKAVRVTEAGEQTFRVARELWKTAQQQVRDIGSTPTVKQLEATIDQLLPLFAGSSTDSD